MISDEAVGKEDDDGLEAVGNEGWRRRFLEEVALVKGTGGVSSGRRFKLKEQTKVLLWWVGLDHLSKYGKSFKSINTSWARHPTWCVQCMYSTMCPALYLMKRTVHTYVLLTMHPVASQPAQTPTTKPVTAITLSW